MGHEDVVLHSVLSILFTTMSVRGMLVTYGKVKPVVVRCAGHNSTCPHNHRKYGMNDGQGNKNKDSSTNPRDKCQKPSGC